MTGPGKIGLMLKVGEVDSNTERARSMRTYLVHRNGS